MRIIWSIFSPVCNEKALKRESKKCPKRIIRIGIYRPQIVPRENYFFRQNKKKRKTKDRKSPHHFRTRKNHFRKFIRNRNTTISAAEGAAAAAATPTTITKIIYQFEVSNSLSIEIWPFFSFFSGSRSSPLPSPVLCSYACDWVVRTTYVPGLRTHVYAPETIHVSVKKSMLDASAKLFEITLKADISRLLFCVQIKLSHFESQREISRTATRQRTSGFCMCAIAQKRWGKKRPSRATWQWWLWLRAREPHVFLFHSWNQSNTARRLRLTGNQMLFIIATSLNAILKMRVFTATKWRLLCSILLEFYSLRFVWHFLFIFFSVFTV